MKLRSFLMILAFVLAMILVILAATGCQHTTPATKAALDQIDQQSQIDVATDQAKAKLSAEQAQTDPVAHPIKAATAAVKKAQAPLGMIATVAFVVAAVGFGLKFYTPLSWLSSILFPVGLAVAGFSFLGVVALPFFPWAIVGLVALFVGLFVYELIRTKSLYGAFEGIEDDFTGHAPTSSTIAAAPIISTIGVQLIHQ